MYTAYKPLRNKLREHNLRNALLVAHAYMQWMQFGTPLPAKLQHWRMDPNAPGKGIGLFEWEVDVFLREALLNCPINGGHRHIETINDFANIANTIKRIENSVWSTRHENDNDIWWELYRIAHRQFHWQSGINHATILRYFKLFNHGEIERIFTSVHNLTPPEFYQFGIGIAGHFMRDGTLRMPVKNEINGVDQDKFDAFLYGMSDTVEGFKDRISRSQSYDVNWAYVFSEIRRTPLIRYGTSSCGELFGPCATYIIRYTTDGVFYSLVGQDGFANAFGASYQSYVGEVLNRSFSGENQTLEEQRYGARKAAKQSVDWIVDHPDATLFIECKARRVQMATRTRLQDVEAIANDLESMSSAFFQTYKTLNDALLGEYPHWKSRGQKIFPLVVTLEDWYGFGHVTDRLRISVDQKLTDAGIDPKIVDEYPYTLCSIEELEIASQVMNQVGILSFMEMKTSGEEKSWIMSTFVQTYFHQQSVDLKAMFPEAWNQISSHQKKT